MAHSLYKLPGRHNFLMVRHPYFDKHDNGDEYYKCVVFSPNLTEEIILGKEHIESLEEVNILDYLNIGGNKLLEDLNFETNYKKLILVQKYNQSAIIPTKGTVGSAAYDIYSLEKVVLPECGATLKEEAIREDLLGVSASVVRVRTGLNIFIPTNQFVLVLPRSGLSSKGIIITNSPGLIDSDYDGNGEDFDLSVLMCNLNSTPYEIEAGERIAQILLPLGFTIEERSWLGRKSDERLGGFGSTGK